MGLTGHIGHRAGSPLPGRNPAPVPHTAVSRKPGAAGDRAAAAGPYPGSPYRPPEGRRDRAGDAIGFRDVKSSSLSGIAIDILSGDRETRIGVTRCGATR